MTKWRLVALGAVIMPAGLAALAAGCSSSSSPATPEVHPGTEAGVEDATTSPEEGDGGGVSLKWAVTLVGVVTGSGAASALPDGGGAGDGDTGDGQPAESAAPSDAATDGEAPVVDATTDGEAGGATVLPPDGTDGSGVRVCVYQNDSIPCVTSAADGTFVFPRVPIRTNLVITLEKTGFVPLVLSIQTASTPMDESTGALYLFPISTEVAWTHPVPGLTTDWQTKGQIAEIAYGLTGGAPGATLSMNTQADGATPSGVGPIYTEATTDNGNPGFSKSGIDNRYSASDMAFLPSPAETSFASFFNVDPGTYTLTTTDTMADCEPVLTPFAPYGFPLPAAPHSVQVVVLKGYLSELASMCTPLSKIVPVDGG